MKKNGLVILVMLSVLNVQGQKEGMIPVADGQLYYREFGQGVPLLIINGGPGMNSDGFITLAKNLSKGNRTIIYDQRGTGRSVLRETNNKTITLEKMARDIEALRIHLKIDSWILLGHSFGGMLAAYYTSIFPASVKGLVLSSSGGIDLDLLSYVNSTINAHLNKTDRDSASYWGAKINAGDSSSFARRQRARFLAAAYLYDKKNVAVIAERLTQSSPGINALVWQNMQAIKFDCSEKLASFTKPVLIIQGKQDIVAEKTALKEKQAFHNSRLVLIDRCAHYGWLDRPDIYYPEIQQFLATLH